MQATTEVQELERKLEHAKIRLETIRELIGEGASGDPSGPGRQRNTKRTVMEIITEAGRAGVTPPEVVDKAAAKGRHLKTTSISSLLSKLKAAGTLTFDGERYYPAGLEPEGPSPLRLVKGVAG